MSWFGIVCWVMSVVSSMGVSVIYDDFVGMLNEVS